MTEIVVKPFSLPAVGSVSASPVANVSVSHTNKVFYPQVYQLRQEQLKQGVDLFNVTSTQWGLNELDKCHHISTTATSKDGPPSYRVRVCKTCCKNDSHIELGTYVDQESAILVNDVHEILQERFDKLIVLRKEDRAFLHLLMAKKYDRHKGRDHSSIVAILSDRLHPKDDKKRRKRLLVLGMNNKMGLEGIGYPSISPSVAVPRQVSPMSSQGNVVGVGSEDDETTSSSEEGMQSTLSQSMEYNTVEDASADGSSDVPAFPVTDSSFVTSVASGSTSPEFTAALNPLLCLTDSILQVSSPMVSRPRAATFSVPSSKSMLSPMTTLTWLASMKDDELAAARLLSELGCTDGSNPQEVSLDMNEDEDEEGDEDDEDDELAASNCHDDMMMDEEQAYLSSLHHQQHSSFSVDDNSSAMPRLGRTRSHSMPFFTTSVTEPRHRCKLSSSMMCVIV